MAFPFFRQTNTQDKVRPIGQRTHTSHDLSLTMPDLEEDVFELQSAAASDVGIERKHNEDSYVAISDNGTAAVMLAVADGMGGYQGGDVASATAAQILQREFLRGNLRSNKDFSRAYRQIDRAIRAALKTAKGGTTCVVTLMDGPLVTVVNIGDSRAYLFRDNKLERLTKDDSLVQSLVDKGQLTEDQALTHPRRNVILKALGTGKFEDPAITHIRFADDDLILLCSDGLCGVMPDRKLEKLLRAALPGLHDAHDLDRLCLDLIKQAIKAGSTDNITVACCRRVNSTDTGGVQASASDETTGQMQIPQGNEDTFIDES